MSMLQTVQQSYRNMLADYGETVTFRSEAYDYTTVPPTVTPSTETALARVVDYASMERHAPELFASARQGDHLLIVLAEDLAAWGEPASGQKVTVRGRVCNVEVVDKHSRSVAGTAVAYNVLVRG